MKKETLVGKTFGKWTVLEQKENNKSGKKQYLCRCECGTTKTIVGSKLVRGKTFSCRPCSKTKHGDCGTKLYMVWGTMVQRCYNEKNSGFKNYGGRGILMCDSWRNSFSEFKKWALKAGYKPGLMIDRIDNDKGYFPENCRFTTRLVQNNNRRNCRNIKLFNKTMTIAQQARRLGVDKDKIRKGLNRGKTEKEIEEFVVNCWWHGTRY